MYNNGFGPAAIALQIRDRSNEDGNPDLEGIANVYINNALQRHFREELAGRRPFQFLYDKLNGLGEEELFYRDSRDEAGRLSRLFIAPKDGIEFFQRYPDILLLNCTYKTNRFNMPVLNIFGVTAERKTFSVASVFLDGEAEPQYRWSLEGLLLLSQKEGNRMPRLTITDRDVALINALNALEPLKGYGPPTLLLARQ